LDISDATLFVWVDLWYHCFSAMLAWIVEISGAPEEQLKQEIRAVHRKHGTSEYSLLIEELPSIKERFPGENLIEVFAPAIGASTSATVCSTMLRWRRTPGLMTCGQSTDRHRAGRSTNRFAT